MMSVITQTGRQTHTQTHTHTQTQIHTHTHTDTDTDTHTNDNAIKPQDRLLWSYCLPLSVPLPAQGWVLTEEGR